MQRINFVNSLSCLLKTYRLKPYFVQVTFLYGRVQFIDSATELFNSLIGSEIMQLQKNLKPIQNSKRKVPGIQN